MSAPAGTQTSAEKAEGQSAFSRRNGPYGTGHTRGMPLYPQERLYQEMSFLAYYLHWSHEDLMNLDHWERRRWCREVSAINKKLSGNERSTYEFK